MGRSTVIGKSSIFESRDFNPSFRRWAWKGGSARHFWNFKFQSQCEGESSLGTSAAQGLRVSNLKFPISNFRVPLSHSDPQGFTLIELMMVLTLLLILATMSLPIFHLAVVHAREAVLKDDLYTLRKLIDEYTLDKQHPPASLDDLVEAGYLRGGIPVDPFTGSNQTWRTDIEDVPLNPSQAGSGIVDVHSGSDETALDGTAYSSW